MALEKRLLRAGLAYMVTQYKDVADSLLTLDTERGMHTKKAEAASHNASVLAYKWAMLNDLPIGGEDFTLRMYDHAKAYREEHDADVQEYLATHETVARVSGK